VKGWAFGEDTRGGCERRAGIRFSAAMLLSKNYSQPAQPYTASLPRKKRKTGHAQKEKRMRKISATNAKNPSVTNHPTPAVQAQREGQPGRNRGKKPKEEPGGVRDPAAKPLVNPIRPTSPAKGPQTNHKRSSQKKRRPKGERMNGASNGPAPHDKTLIGEASTRVDHPTDGRGILKRTE